MWSSQLHNARRMEGKWTRPATEAGQSRQGFGVNNREKSPKQRQVISDALICRPFVNQWGSFNFSNFNVTREYQLGKNNNDSFFFGSTVVELLV